MQNETPVKHTPGPWRLDALSAHRVVGPALARIADCGTDSVHPMVEERCAANARLIAAAPALLEAAEMLLQHHRVADLLRSDTAAPRVHALQAAIAQARGE